MPNEEYQKWLEKLENYCAYQERCISEVKTKMYSLKIPTLHSLSLLESLIENKFLEEERYVRAFMRSKVIFKKWFQYRLTPVSVIGAYAFGMTGVYLNTRVLMWDWNLNVYWGFIMSTIFLKLYCTLKPIKPLTA